MKELNIYVAGPVLRMEYHRPFGISLRFLYGQIEAEAKLAGVVVQIPYHERELDQLEANQFAKEIARRIQKADAMLVVVLQREEPNDTVGYSIACEAQIGAGAGKPVAILARHAGDVPRLLRALAARETYTFGSVNFQQLFRDLAELSEREIRT